MPAFKAAIEEAKVHSVMMAYNRVNGIPAPASEWLMKDILRGEMGFDGYVVSDCWAIRDIFEGHDSWASDNFLDGHYLGHLLMVDAVLWDVRCALKGGPS